MYRKLTINGNVDTLIQSEHISININGAKEKRFYKNSSSFDKLKERATKKSRQFKTFALEQLFPKDHFDIESLDNNYKNEPDFLVKHQKRKKFYVKCTFRGYLFKGRYDWIRKDQLQCFREFAETNKKPVYFTLGLSGCPKDPDHVYIMPLENADCRLKLAEMDDFKINDENDIYRILKI